MLKSISKRNKPGFLGEHYHQTNKRLLEMDEKPELFFTSCIAGLRE